MLQYAKKPSDSVFATSSRRNLVFSRRVVGGTVHIEHAWVALVLLVVIIIKDNEVHAHRLCGPAVRLTVASPPIVSSQVGFEEEARAARLRRASTRSSTSSPPARVHTRARQASLKLQSNAEGIRGDRHAALC